MTSASKGKKPKRARQRTPKRPPRHPPKQTGRTLRGRMARIRRELAALNAGNGDADLFQSSLEQLYALANEIAEATDRMMTACEEIQESADAIGAKTKHRGIKAQLKKITAGTVDIFEACSFQDLTGQRIGKLTRTVAAFHTGFHAIARLAVGKSAGNGSAPKSAEGKNRHHAIDRIDGGITLEGPQINGPAVSQADIDSLFD